MLVRSSKQIIRRVAGPSVLAASSAASSSSRPLAAVVSSSTAIPITKNRRAFSSSTTHRKQDNGSSGGGDGKSSSSNVLKESEDDKEGDGKGAAGTSGGAGSHHTKKRSWDNPPSASESSIEDTAHSKETEHPSSTSSPSSSKEKNPTQPVPAGVEPLSASPDTPAPPATSASSSSSPANENHSEEGTSAAAPKDKAEEAEGKEDEDIESRIIFGEEELKKILQMEKYQNVLAIPMSGFLLPKVQTTITIRDPIVMSTIRNMTDVALDPKGPSRMWCTVFIQKDPSQLTDLIGSPEEVYQVGCFCEILQTQVHTVPERGVSLTVKPHKWVALDQLASDVTPDSIEVRDAKTQALAADITASSDAMSAPLEVLRKNPAWDELELPSSFPLTNEVSEGEAEESPFPTTVSVSDLLSPTPSSAMATLIESINLGNVYFSQEPFELSTQLSTEPIDVLVEFFGKVNNVAPNNDQVSKIMVLLEKLGHLKEDETLLAEIMNIVTAMTKATISSLPRPQFRHQNFLGHSGGNSRGGGNDHTGNLQFFLMSPLQESPLGRFGGGAGGMGGGAMGGGGPMGGPGGMPGREPTGPVKEFMDKAAKLKMPEAVAKAFQTGLTKLASSPQHGDSSTESLTAYLDWLVSVPWGEYTVDNSNISEASKILNEDHYGMKDVKDRILEFLSVTLLKKDVKGKILCFVGPPGVGKTSVAKSIARALGRKFHRISVGGMDDAAAIKGHRRTYVASFPGMIVTALKTSGSQNPVILLDEIEKTASVGKRGVDMSSVFLEVLDPEQNSNFTDHYLDVPIDLSKVLFLCTANDLSMISGPLRDRMEIIELDGYVTEEKLAIAEKYLIPTVQKENGLESADVQVEKSVLTHLIEFYAREPGVRNLKKHVDMIFRKAAHNIVKILNEREIDVSPKDEKGEPIPIEIPSDIKVAVDLKNMKDFVGPRVIHDGRLYAKEKVPAGVVYGLGYTSNGAGCIIPLEVNIRPGKGNLKLTGQLQEVMTESANVALSWIKSNAHDLGILTSETDEFNFDLHLHAPEGSIKKEGPSAGSALTTAMVSALLKKKVDPLVAMTGEITLGGRVTAVGGLTGKMLAAQREGMKKLLVPEQCREDIEANVPESIRKDLELVYVTDIKDVLLEAFKDDPITTQWREKWDL